MTTNQGETLEYGLRRSCGQTRNYTRRLWHVKCSKKLQEREGNVSCKADLEKAKESEHSLNSHGSSTRAPNKVNSLDDAFNAAAEKYGL